MMKISYLLCLLVYFHLIILKHINREMLTICQNCLLLNDAYIDQRRTPYVKLMNCIIYLVVAKIE